MDAPEVMGSRSSWAWGPLGHSGELSPQAARGAAPSSAAAPVSLGGQGASSRTRRKGRREGRLQRVGGCRRVSAQCNRGYGCTGPCGLTGCKAPAVMTVREPREDRPITLRSWRAHGAGIARSQGESGSGSAFVGGKDGAWGLGIHSSAVNSKQKGEVRGGRGGHCGGPLCGSPGLLGRDLGV